jgi:hypothetical protein
MKLFVGIPTTKIRSRVHHLRTSHPARLSAAVPISGLPNDDGNTSNDLFQLFFLFFLVLTMFENNNYFKGKFGF